MPDVAGKKTFWNGTTWANEGAFRQYVDNAVCASLEMTVANVCRDIQAT